MFWACAIMWAKEVCHTVVADKLKVFLPTLKNHVNGFRWQKNWEMYLLLGELVK